MNNDTTTEVWKQYQDCINFRKKTGIDDNIKLWRNFYEGRQWGEWDEKDEEKPRPQFNFCEMIVDNKVAGILATPLRVVYSSSSNNAMANTLNDFNSFIEKEIDLDKICSKCVNDGAVEGASVLYAYWDADAIGTRGEYKGGVRVERIELDKIGFHNPTELDVQKQKWIIIQSRVELETAKNICKDKKLKELITPDDEFIKDDDEQDNSKLVTILTKFYRINGEVYFDQCTKSVVLLSKQPLNPKKNKQKIDNIDGAESKLQEEAEQPKMQSKYMASLYPIAIYNYKERKKNIYGRGEVEPILRNNRIVNWNTAMMAVSVENQAWGTLVEREGASPAGQEITNDPTQVLIDKSKVGNGYYLLNKQPFSPQAMQLNNDIVELTRATTGSTEVMSGELMGANQSGTSIALLQQQAQKPIDRLAKRYREFRKDIAKIMLQFFILYYSNKTFVKTQKEGGEEQQVSAVFNGYDYEPYDFDISIDVGASNQFSDITLISMLEARLQSGQISLKTYYKTYPNLPNREDFLRDIEEQENSQLQQLAMQIHQMTLQNEQANAVIKQYQEIVNNIASTIKENTALKAILAEQQQKIFELQTNGANTYKDAQDLAIALANRTNQN